MVAEQKGQRSARSNGASGYAQRAEARAKRPQTSIIVPAYNEEVGIGVVLEKLCSVIDESFEIIVVDDGSTDATKQVARRFPCRVVSHPVNQGKGKAVQSGIRAARAERIILIDADDTYPVDAITNICQTLNRADMVVASRMVGQEHIPLLNRWGNWFIRHMLRYLYGFKPKDPLTGLYAIKKHFLEKMDLQSNGFSIESEIALKAARMGLRIEDLPITYGQRIGKSKLNGLRDGYAICRTIFKMLALYNPTALFVIPGSLLFALGAALACFLLIAPISLGAVVLETNTLLVSGILSLAGFHIVVFGMTLNLYGLIHKSTRPNLVTKTTLQTYTSGWMRAIATLTLIAAVVLGLVLTQQWALSGFGPFTQTPLLILTSYLGVLGLELLLSSIFLSVFLDELRLRARARRV